MNQSFPTPTLSKLEFGPFTIHFYALFIIIGIVVAIWLGDLRFRRLAINGNSIVAEVAFAAVPAGIIGGRIYHVISSPGEYFGATGNLFEAIKIWQGGLGIWGAISAGFLGAFLRYRYLQRSVDLPSFAVFADALAPGVLLAQAIGRFGNWFNGELFGAPLDSWWALEIPLRYRPFQFRNYESFHPTFAYEAIWCVIIALLLLKFGTKLKQGQNFSAYVFAYCFGRFFIEFIRIDDASIVAGLRINVWVSLFVAFSALIFFIRAYKTE